MYVTLKASGTEGPVHHLVVLPLGFLDWVKHPLAEKKRWLPFLFWRIGRQDSVALIPT